MEFATITGKIRIVTGLRIGAGGASLEIGGADNPIVRHPVTREPYLPGSSLKGKMRSLLERDHFALPGLKSASLPYTAEKDRWENNRNVKKQVTEQNDKDPCSCGECPVCWLFGCGKIGRSKGQTRLIFRDCKLAEDDAKTLAKGSEAVSFYTETKSEVQIARKPGVDANPRPNDRIPSGLSLDLEISVRIIGDDKVELMKVTLGHAFSKLERDSLGGSGSRGYGQVKFGRLGDKGEFVEGELLWDGQPWDIHERAGTTA